MVLPVFSKRFPSKIQLAALLGSATCRQRPSCTHAGYAALQALGILVCTAHHYATMCMATHWQRLLRATAPVQKLDGVNTIGQSVNTLLGSFSKLIVTLLCMLPHWCSAHHSCLLHCTHS